MVTMEYIVALIGTLLFITASSQALTSYSPFKIPVNENFNAQPGQVSTEPQALEPGTLHQGANFYFKPQLNFIPSHIEALISLIKQKHHSCAKDASKVVVDKDKLIEILQPFMYPSKILKDTLLGSAFEKGNNFINMKPKEIIDKIVTEPGIITEESNPLYPQFHVIPEAPVLPKLSLKDISAIIEKEVKKEEAVMLKETMGEFSTIPEIAVRPIMEPIINYFEPKLIAAEHVNIPEAPFLPSLSINSIPPTVEEEIKKEEPVILEGQRGVSPTISEIINSAETKSTNKELQIIPEPPVLPPLSANDIKLIEDEVKINEYTVDDVGPKPAIQEYTVIPEAPVLSPVTHQDVASFVEDKKKEISIIFKKPREEFSTIPEIAVTPNQEPTNNNIELNTTTSELLVMPEAPVLPPLSGNAIPFVEEVKNEEPIFVDVDTKPVIQELVISEAPTLPPLSANNIKLIEDGVNFNGPIVVDVEPIPINTEFQVISKAPEAPVLPLLSANDDKAIEGGVKISQNAVVDIESKPEIRENVIIPEAPVLPPLTLHDISSSFVEDMKTEVSIIFKEPTGVFSTIPEIAMRPIQEPINEYIEPEYTTSELLAIPEAPVLPPLSANEIKFIEEGVKFNEPIIIDDEPKPINTEFQVIPEAPVLPPLSANDIKLIEEGFDGSVDDAQSKAINKEFQVIHEAPILSTLSANNIKPIEEGVKFNEPIIIDAEPKPNNTEFQVIPEAPVLPTRSANDIKLIEEGVKFNKPVVEFKPAVEEHVGIPEAPVLPPLSLHEVHSIVEEEVKKEESVTLEKSKGCDSTLPKEPVDPNPKPIVNYDESKTATSNLGVILEAPVLPPLSAKDIHLIEEAVKIEEPVRDMDELRPFISNHLVIPEAPVLPDLSLVEESMGELPSNPIIAGRPIEEPILVSESAESFALENNIFPVATEDVKIEVPILVEETIELFPPIAEISSGPTQETIQEPEMINSYVLEEVPQLHPDNVLTVKETLPLTIIPKPSNNLGVFSYAPFLSQLSNRAPKTNKLKIAKPASLERFLLKKHLFRLPVTPFPKLSLNAMKNSLWENKKQFLYPTTYAHDVVEKRIAPNMAFKKNAPPKRVKIYVRSQVPKGSSYL